MYETGIQSDPEPTQPSRPRQATTLAVLLIIFGVLGILSALLLNDSLDHGQSVPAIVSILVYVQFVISAAQATSGVFVWQGREWARMLAIVLCSVNLVGALVSLFAGAIFQAIAAFVIYLSLLRLLTSDDVRQWCAR